MALRPVPDTTLALVRAKTLHEAACRTQEAAQEAARQAAFVRFDAEQELDRRVLEARGAVWGETLVMLKPGAYKPYESGHPCRMMDVARRDRNRPCIVLRACDAQGRPLEDGVFTTWLDQVDIEAEVRLEPDDGEPALT